MSSSFLACMADEACSSSDSGSSSSNIISTASSVNSKRHASRRKKSRQPLITSFNSPDECLTCQINDQQGATRECFDGTAQSRQSLYPSHCDENGMQSTSVRRKPRRRHQQTQRYTASWHSLFLLFTLLMLVLTTSVLGSQGDRSPEYNKCVDSCKLDSCFVDPKWDDGTAHATRLPLMLRLTGWTCIDDCKYHCTHRVTNEAYERVTRIRRDSIHLVEAEADKEKWSKAEQRKKIDELVNIRLAVLRPVQKQMVQFHGKWVFIRFLGAQEPLSVLFSLLNFHVHFRALSTLRKQVPDVYPLKLVYIIHVLLSCSAWFWSSVFHARDKNWTEKLDYFSAGSVILGGWFVAVCRLFRLKPDTVVFNFLAKGCGVAFAMHIIYLSIGRFDYSYNMKVNIFFGLFQSALWLAHSIRPHFFSQISIKLDRHNSTRTRTLPASPTITSNPMVHSSNNNGSPPVPVSTPSSLPPSSSRKSKRQLQKVILLLLLASCLEVFDFPPIGRALDAHALWHAATIPLAAMWYQFLVEDARECTLTGYWVGEGLRFQKSETVENIGKVASALVGPQVVHAYEKTIQGSIAAKKWVENVAGKSSIAIKDAAGTSSGIEFKTLTNKLNEVASGAFGNSASIDSSRPTTNASTTRNRTQSISSNAANTGLGSSGFGTYSTEREREKLHELNRRTMV